MKKSSISRNQNRSWTHAVSCIQRTQIVTHLTVCNTFGYNWKNPSVTLVEGKGNAVPVHRKKKYYNTPWRRAPFKKLTILSQSPPFTEPEASLPYSHTLTPNFFRIHFTIIFTYVFRVSSSL